MRRPLATTYRPQRFEDVLGQQAPIRALTAAVRKGDVASSYIFSGTRGIGKTTIARLFAKALNCENGPDLGCEPTCSSCSEISEGRCLDVLELDAATHTGIDDVRELREAAQYPPSHTKFRVFIIDEAHQLSSAAWNGLLKILEEPPAWCVFAFCTTEPHKIPQTIESRSMHFAFRSPTPQQIEDHLRKIAGVAEIEVDDEALTLLSQAADGSVRDGLSALDQSRAVAEGALNAATVREALGLVSGEAIDAYIAALASADSHAALDTVASLEAEGQDLRVFIAEVLGKVRTLAVARARGQKTALGDTLSSAQWVAIGRILDATELRLRQGGAVRTLVDLATVRMLVVTDLEPLESLAAKIPEGGGTGPGTHPAPRAPGARPTAGRGGSGTARPAPRGASASRAVPSRAPTSPSPNVSASRSNGTGHAAGEAANEVETAPPPSPSAAPTLNANAGAEELLAQLIATVESIRAPVAAYLSRVCDARLDDRGLTLTVPAGKGFWKRKLDEDSSARVIREAIEQLTGQPTSVSVEQQDDEVTAAPKKSVSRDDILARARRDPTVRALFDRFGAVVLDARPGKPAAD